MPEDLWHTKEILELKKQKKSAIEPDKPNINYFAYFSYYPPPWNQLVSWDASFQFNEV